MKRLVVILFVLFLSGIWAAGQELERTPAKAATDKTLAGGISVGIVVDNSGSFRSILDRVITSTTAIANDLKGSDEGFLVTFVDTPKIVLRQEMTREGRELIDSAENMFIEGGPTAILDAVVFASKYMAGQSSGQNRVIILITDGDERESAATVESAIKAAKDAGVKIFVLGLHEEKLYTKVIDRLVKETGGAKFVPKFPKNTPAAVTDLLSAMRGK